MATGQNEAENIRTQGSRIKEEPVEEEGSDSGSNGGNGSRDSNLCFPAVEMNSVDSEDGEESTSVPKKRIDKRRNICFCANVDSNNLNELLELKVKLDEKIAQLLSSNVGSE